MIRPSVPLTEAAAKTPGALQKSAGRFLLCCYVQERIMRSLANSPPLAVWNLASRSET